MNCPRQLTKQKRLFALLGWTYRRFTHVLTILSSIGVNTRNWMHVRSVTQSAKRYKIRQNDPSDVDGEHTQPKVTAKVLWYYPIMPRLERLFRNKTNAKLMRWH